MSASPAERLACRTPGCPNTIQPATAARTGGYCGPCAGIRAREARQAYIRANRRDVDRYAGVSDPVDLLRLMHTLPEPDPLVNLLPPPKSFEEIYLSLTSKHAMRLIDIAIHLLPIDEYRAGDIAKCLAAFTDFSLEPLLQTWLDHDRVYPALIFRGAAPSIRDQIIGSQYNDCPTLRANHALSAVAWIGDESVIDYLQRVEAERPDWTDRLHISPTAYARVAGWELVAGQRRELTLPTCLALHVAKSEEPKAENVQVMRPREDSCPCCGGGLVNLIEADHLDGPSLDPLHQLGQRIEIMTCPLCTRLAEVHAELDREGRGRWATRNVPSTFLSEGLGARWQPSPWSSAAVRLSERRPTHAADWCLPTALSQIGGFPAWVQDVEYPACLKCGRTMIFIAQIDQGAFKDEGVYYAFVCGECRTTATTYQQT